MSFPHRTGFTASVLACPRAPAECVQLLDEHVEFTVQR